MTTSIVIATYNGEKYIEEQICSLLSQTKLPDEIVICDDCSGDATLEKIKKCLDGTLIPYKFICHKRNLGVYRSFYDGLQKASGEIIFFCDQDDFWHSDKVEKFVAEFEKDKGTALVLSNAEIVGQDLSKTGKTLWKTLNFSVQSDLFSEMLRRNIFTGMCMASRREFLTNHLKVSKNMLHDEYIGWISLFFGKVKILNLTLAKYRQHANNVVGSSRRKKFTSIASMRQQVKASSILKREKFKELLDIVEDSNFYKSIEKAYIFYNYRVLIFEEGKIKGLISFFKKNISGEYSKYTSKTEHARFKDLLCILL